MQGVEGMFKRLTTSLTKPPQAVFFMKDSWGKVILYLLFIPLFLMIPSWLKGIANPGMTLSRYELMVQSITQGIILEDTKITEGVLETSEEAKTVFEYFQINIGTYTPTQDKIHFVFLPQDLAIYVSDIEIQRTSYQSIGLENYDFSDRSQENIRMLATGIKAFYNQTSLFETAEAFVAYASGLFDLLFYALLMSFFVMMFTRHLPLPFGMRFKLSIYLSTIYVVVELVAVLFNSPGISYLVIPLLYVWHFWAYRSIKIVDKGLTV